MRWRNAAAGLALVAGVSGMAPPVRAEVVGGPRRALVVTTAPPPSKVRRVAATAAAIVPGVALIGSGSFVLGNRRAARRLATLQLIGLAAIVAGGAPQAATYGSARVAPLIPLLLGGVATWLAGWAGDLWIATGADASGARPRRQPRLSLELGSVVARDPLRGARAYAALDADLAAGRWRLAGALLASVERDEQRLRLAAEHPLWRRAGTTLGLRLRGEHFRNQIGPVDATRLDVALRGHLDGAAVTPELAGTFAEFDVGAGVEIDQFEPGGTDLTDRLVARMAWGRHIGAGGALRLFYDHRRDGLAGGIAASRASGFVGTIGALAEVPVAPGWAATGSIEFGAGWVFGAGLRHDLGASP